MVHLQTAWSKKPVVTNGALMCPRAGPARLLPLSLTSAVLCGQHFHLQIYSRLIVILEQIYSLCSTLFIGNLPGNISLILGSDTIMISEILVQQGGWVNAKDLQERARPK